MEGREHIQNAKYIRGERWNPVLLPCLVHFIQDRTLVLKPLDNLGSASPQAARCEAPIRRHSGAMSRNGNETDGCLWTRPAGGNQNAQHCVALA